MISLEALLSFDKSDIMQRKETQRKILVMDILTVLAAIKKAEPINGIDAYIGSMISGEILDKKAKKEAWKLFGNSAMA